MDGKKQTGIHRITGPKQSEHIAISIITEEQRIEAEFDRYMKQGRAISRLNFALLMLGVTAGLAVTAIVLFNFSSLVQSVLAPTAAKAIMKMGLL